MRKLLQSKAVVSGLVGVAIVAVAANFVSLPKPFGVSATERASSDPVAEPTESAIKMPPQSRFITEQKMWRELFPVDSGVRDPFALPAEPRAPVTKTGATTAEPTSAAPELILRAISREPGHAYAVVNQQVLAVGERIAGYEVERISADSVELRGPTGSISLSLPKSTARQIAPIVKPAEADLPAAIRQSSPPGMPR